LRQIRCWVVEHFADTLDAAVLVQQEGAIGGDRVRMMILVVYAVAKVERAFVVDLAKHDRPRRPNQWRKPLSHGFQPTIRFVQKGDTGIARDGEGQRGHRQHHGHATRRTRLAVAVPDHALGDAEERELGVDVWPGSHDRQQTQAVREIQEAHGVQSRIARAEVEASVRLLVDAPGQIHIDDVDA